MALLVKERMPLRLHAEVATPSGYRRRWGPDERKPEYALDGLTFSSTIPGGFEAASNSLARKIASDLPDLEELSTVTIRGVGGQIAGQYRLEDSPRTWGDQSTVTPQLVGWQSHLDDNTAARTIFVDSDRSHWGGPSLQRQINNITGSIDMDDPSNAPDQTTGYPSVVTGVTGPDPRARTCEAWYDANGIDLGPFYYAWKLDGNIDPSDANWWLQAFLSSDDLLGSSDATGNIMAAGPGSGTLSASVAGRKWAMVELLYNAALRTGISFKAMWTCLAAYANHGLPLQGAGDFQTPPAVLASDAVAYTVGKWAPLLSFTVGSAGTIIPSTFPIPHLTFPDATTASAIVKGATAFELQDWAVWDGLTFWWYPRGTYGRAWRAPVGPSQLQETGPQGSRLFNGVVVLYTDVTGAARSVGPPGSGCTTEDSSLADSDPSNPANELGISKWSPPLQMGTGTAGMAIKIGAGYLAEQKLLDTSGQATLTGHVQDDATGIWWPAWMVRAGDTIRFSDAHDTSLRRIVRTEWNDTAKTCGVSLDSPPDGMQQFLDRLGADLVGVGL